MKVPTKKVLQDQIKKINIATAVISVVLAVTSALALSSTTVTVWLNYMARNALVQGNEVVLTPALKELFSVQIRYLFVFMFGVSAVFALLLATKLRTNYETTVKKKLSAYKWIFIGITSALSVGIIAMLSGLTEIAEVKVIIGLVIIASLFGWLSEREAIFSSSKKWLPFVLSIIAGLVAWLPIVSNVVGTSVYGMERFTWSVYALAVIVFASFVLYGLNQYMYLADKKGWKEYLFIERNHLFIDLASKVAIGIIIIAALGK